MCSGTCSCLLIDFHPNLVSDVTCSDVWYWSWNNCTQYIKINLEGSVALIHEHGVPGKADTSKLMTQMKKSMN
jgi:hypothetical protein